jgi:hypothetical protein
LPSKNLRLGVQKNGEPGKLFKGIGASKKWRKEYNQYLPNVSNEEKIAKNSNQSYGVTNPHSFDCPVM